MKHYTWGERSEKRKWEKGIEIEDDKDRKRKRIKKRNREKEERMKTIVQGWKMVKETNRRQAKYQSHLGKSKYAR